MLRFVIPYRTGPVDGAPFNLIIQLTGAFNVVSLVGVLEPEEVIPGCILGTFFGQIFYCAGGAILEINNFLASVDA